MDDQGFDFRTAPGRREPKQFEPPPWEREAFERLRTERVVDEVAKAAEDLEDEIEADAAGGDAGASEQHADEEVPLASEGERQEEPVVKGPTEAEVIELLAGLAAEEPDPRGPATKVTIGSALVLMPIGLAVLVWGMVAFVKAGEAVANVGVARTGAVTMMLFGAGFVASAFWLIYRLMKQRGVL